VYQQPEQVILELLKRARGKSGRSVLVTGPWGCGKTHLWKELAVPKLGRPTMYISAFGAEGATGLKGRLLGQIGLGLLQRVPGGVKVAAVARAAGAKLGRAGKGLEAALNSVGAGVLRRADIDAIELAELVPSETVICIDDIERTGPNFPIEELMGLVNILCEHKGFDVVLICNEDRIRENERGPYKELKEKVVAFELALDGDPDAMFDRMTEGSGGTALERVRGARAEILDVFRRSQTKNLRLLAKVVDRIEALTDAGVRELTAEEVRFLTAVVLHLASESPGSDGFYEMKALGVRLIARMAVSRGTEATEENKKQIEFLEMYFGDAEYQFHPGIFGAVKRGRIDRTKFLPVPTPQGLAKTLGILASGEWRFWEEARTRRFLGDLIGHLKAGEGTARDVLECLMSARFLATILEVPEPEELAPKVRDTLQARADADDETLAPHPGQRKEDLPLVEKELEFFADAVRKRRRQRLAHLLRQKLEAREEAEVVSLITSDQTALRVLFEEVGIESAVKLRGTGARTFNYVMKCVLQQLALQAPTWPEARGHLDELRGRLKSITESGEEDLMVRWRVRSLLEDWPTGAGS
jgi:hypothetical protein